ncbi:hypothetical protein K438DRAFT_1981062 [Mycena galopus ATCC 62051]|nr:hypothetical protein K438DRAFT_1981062 [Mycena galopus ATCC 62051]
MHGMEAVPLMLPMEEHLHLSTERKRVRRSTISPHQLNATNLAKLPRWLVAPTPRGLLGSGREAHQVIADFEEQLYQRASKSLQLNDDYFVAHHLVSVTSDGERSGSSIGVGLCNLCLASQHDSELECPRFGTYIDEGGMGMKNLMNVLVGDAETTTGVDELEVTASREGAGDQAKKTKPRCIPAVSGPVLQDEAFQTLVDAAVDARKAFEDNTEEYDGDKEGSGCNEDCTIMLADADQIGVGVRIRPATPFSPPFRQLYLPPRQGTPEPEDRHSDDGTPVLRRCTSVPPSHADHIVTPSFTRRGRVIMRDHWSSSPASLPGGPLYENDEFNSPAERVEVVEHGEWSLAVSEWVWGWPSSYPPSYVTASEDPSSTSSESYGGFSCTSRCEFYADDNSDLHESLSFWVREGNEYQRDHRRFENEMGVEPLHQAVQALHGPLSFFVDYLAMAGQGVKEIISAAFPPPPFHMSTFPVEPNMEPHCGSEPSDELPSPIAAPTSLDYSLPSTLGRPIGSSALANSATSDGEWEEVIIEPLSTGPRKRKHPDGEEGGLNQQGHRRKTRKFHGDSLRQTVIEREALLEALRRIKDMVWHRYGVTEFAFPDKLIRHPFMFPLEAAKLQVLWHILQRNGRDILADAIHEVLSIQLPEHDWEYWHLLDEEHPQSLYLRNFDITDYSSNSGSMGGLEYPPSEDGPAADVDGVGVGHHEPCRDLNGAGPITLTISLHHDDAVPVDMIRGVRRTAVWTTHTDVPLANSLEEMEDSDEPEILNEARRLTCTTFMSNQSPVIAIHDAMTDILTNVLVDNYSGEYQSFTLYQRFKGGMESDFPGILEWDGEDETEVCPVDALYDDGTTRHVFTMYKRIDKKIWPVSTTFSLEYENLPRIHQHFSQPLD